MDRERLKILLDKFSKGFCTPEEKEEVMEWYRSLDENGEDAIKEYGSDTDAYINTMFQQFMQEYISQSQPAQKRKINLRVSLLRVAAVLIILVAIGVAVSYLFKDRTSHVQLPAVVSNGLKAGGKIVESHYLKLPDSSVVVLHAGSTLKMDSTHFNAQTREIALNGEAYFDIHHEADRPFIIHTGNIKVTVLGTAFNIKQTGDSIAVTVTRGKVKVEDAHKVLAILTPNQQVVYNSVQAVSDIKQVSAKPATQWVVQDMQFENTTFEQVAETLQQRYQVSISFSNANIKNCKVTITDAFDGTETLDKVLDVICTTFNCTFTHTGKGIVINGEGCPAS